VAFAQYGALASTFSLLRMHRNLSSQLLYTPLISLTITNESRICFAVRMLREANEDIWGGTEA
jgi:hypothetical protein